VGPRRATATEQEERILTNRFGQGIARTTKALELNGNPPAEYQFDAHSFTVTLRRKIN
jgi:predicted HTH transcriptional regulator